MWTWLAWLICECHCKGSCLKWVFMKSALLLNLHLHVVYYMLCSWEMVVSMLMFLERKLHGNSWCSCWDHVHVEKVVPHVKMLSSYMWWIVSLVAMCNAMFMCWIKLRSTPMSSDSWWLNVVHDVVGWTASIESHSLLIKRFVSLGDECS